MARSSTSWTPQNAPKGKGSSKNASTKLKESLGLDGWEKLEKFLLNEGAEKLISCMMELKPHQFVIAYDKLSEFVKPKLSRQTIVGEKGAPVNIEIIKTYANQPDPETDKSV